MTINDFRIDKCEDCLRITRTDLPGDKHTHVKSKKLAEQIIMNVCSGKIPLHSHSRTLESMARLSDDENYVSKIREILDHRKSKCKQKYVNDSKKNERKYR